MKGFIFFLLLGITILVDAQPKQLRYSGSMAAGLLVGQGRNAMQLQTVNGMQYKTWLAGLGIGLDAYHTRTLPVFLHVQKNIASSRKTPFVYLDAGMNIPIPKESERRFVLENRNGFYGEGGVGIELPVTKHLRFFMGGGWRLKTFSQIVNSQPFISIWPPPESSKRDNQYTLTTISVKGGLRF